MHLIRNVIFRGVLLCTVLSFLTAPAPALELIPHTASYTAKFKKGVSLNGTAVRELVKLDNGRWRYRFDVESMVADIDESVVFEWQNNQVKPLQYRYELSGFFIRDRHQDVAFDWPALKARGSHKDKTWELPIPPNALDRLGYQLQLLVDVQLEKPIMHYQVVHKNKIRPGTFRILREEPIDTVLGTVDSVLVEKVRAPEKQRETLLWFSKKYPFLLLKMNQVEEDGEEYEINLKSSDLLP